MPDRCPESLLRLEATEASFLQDLLRGALDWPIPAGVRSLEEIAYQWDLSELRLEDFGVRLKSRFAMQLPDLEAEQPFTVFMMEVSDYINLDARTGLHMLLNKFIRVLQSKSQRPTHLVSWKPDDLLLIFTKD
ncbi:MAG: hypothetical protein GEEBNDBF_02716 [bacterium]|nr:hypothetical protein [bacterium]